MQEIILAQALTLAASVLWKSFSHLNIRTHKRALTHAHKHTHTRTHTHTHSCLYMDVYARLKIKKKSQWKNTPNINHDFKSPSDRGKTNSDWYSYLYYLSVSSIKLCSINSNDILRHIMQKKKRRKKKTKKKLPL